VEFSQAVHDYLFPEGKDRFAKDFHLFPSKVVLAPGAYNESGVMTNNPSSQVVLNFPKISHIDDNLRKDIEGYSSAIGLLTKQQAGRVSCATPL